MKKHIIITTILAMSFSLTMAVSAGYAQTPSGTPQGVTVTQPPIIPEGTTNNSVTSPSSAPTVPQLQLPGVGTDTGLGLPQQVIPNITNLVIALTGGLSLLFTILGGIQALTAYGNEEKLGQAKKTVTWALVGLVIALLSYAIVQILISIKII